MPAVGQDCTELLLALTEDYQRSCAFLSELEEGLRAGRTAAGVSSSGVIDSTLSQPSDVEANSSTAIIVPSLRANTGLSVYQRDSIPSFRRQTSRTAEEPDIDDSPRLSVINLGSIPIDECVPKPSSRRLSSLYQTRRPTALQPSIVFNRSMSQVTADNRQNTADWDEALQANTSSPTQPPLRRSMTGSMRLSLESKRSDPAPVAPYPAKSPFQIGLPGIIQQPLSSSQEFQDYEDLAASTSTSQGRLLPAVHPQTTWCPIAMPAPSSPGGGRQVSLRARSQNRVAFEPEPASVQQPSPRVSMNGIVNGVSGGLAARKSSSGGGAWATSGNAAPPRGMRASPSASSLTAVATSTPPTSSLPALRRTGSRSNLSVYGRRRTTSTGDVVDVVEVSDDDSDSDDSVADMMNSSRTLPQHSRAWELGAADPDLAVTQAANSPRMLLRPVSDSAGMTGRFLRVSAEPVQVGSPLQAGPKAAAGASFRATAAAVARTNTWAAPSQQPPPLQQQQQQRPQPFPGRALRQRSMSMYFAGGEALLAGLDRAEPGAGAVEGQPSRRMSHAFYKMSSGI